MRKPSGYLSGTLLPSPVQSSRHLDRSVLLVAAGRMQADHFRSALTASGAVVEVIRSVNGAVDRLAQRSFDVVVLDWKTLEVEHLGGEWRAGWSRLAEAAHAQRNGPAGLVTLFDGELVFDPVLERAGAIGLRDALAAEPALLVEAIENAAGRQAPPAARRARAAQPDLGDFLIGRTPAIQKVMEQIRLVAAKDTSVLITGETGTGKERVSRAIHLLSQRGERDMVSVNCGGIPATLLEDEFFGHVKGAFTDARTARVGRFEQAHGSTIFLDEIGDLPLELQPKLLRALQEHEIHRIGGVDALQLDVRVIAATNADLWRRVEEKHFREDLFYRINVFPIHLPPLRERRDDIPLFLEFFIGRFCRRDRLPPKHLSAPAMDVLCARPWRGNIRELENAAEIAVIRSLDRQEISLDDFPSSRDERPRALAPQMPAVPDGAGIDFRRLTSAYERALIRHAMTLAGGNKNRAAQILQLKRTTLIEKLKRIDLD